MTADKVRTNVYLNRQLKEEAKKLFKEYGMSFSDGINFLLEQVIYKDNKLDIEPIYPNDPDYKIAKSAYKNYKENPNEYVDFDEWKKEISKKDLLQNRNTTCLFSQKPSNIRRKKCSTLKKQ